MDSNVHMEKLFGVDDSGCIAPRHINQLLKLAWAGGIPSDGLRALCWRVFLGLISPSDKGLWESELLKMVEDYQSIRAKVMPSLDKVQVDPLSQLSAGGNQEDDEWSIYYKNVDLINFIKTDLDRLYISGIPEEHFESPQRRDMLLGILLIWSYQHPVISYRQGMHEIAGYVMYCVEQELSAWITARDSGGVGGKPGTDEYGLLNAITEQNVEAHTFHLYARIMNELEPIYDPVAFTPRGAESQPFVVQFSTKIQEHYLRMLDSELCMHLEECHVSAQIYGLRWARILLGREFTATDAQIYKIWDYLFACCYEAETVSAEALLDADAPTNVNSVLASVRIAGHNRHANEVRRNITSMGTVKHVSPNESSAPSMPQYVCTPLLGALGDVMLAMMLNIRDQLVEGDSSTVLGLLMHYPDMPSVTPILDYADMIKRGVIMGPEKKHCKTTSLKKQNVPLRIQHGSTVPTASPNPSAGGAAGGMWNLQSMKQRLSQVTQAVSNGISEMVSNLAEYGEEEPSPAPNYSHNHSQSNNSKGHTASSLASAAAAGAQKETGKQNSASSGASSAKSILSSKSLPTTTTTAESKSGKSSSINPLSEQAAEENAISPPPPALVLTIETDPLSGLLGPSSTTSASSQQQPPPGSPLLTGKGTGYKNMPADVVLPSSSSGDDPLWQPTHGNGLNNSGNNSSSSHVDGILSSPSITGFHIRSKIFNNGWFPSSTAKKERRRTRRENRSSGGVDLHVLHSSLKASAAAAEAAGENGMDSSGGGSSEDEDSSDAQQSGSGSGGGVAKKNTKLRGLRSGGGVDKNAVGDRLLDLADALVHPAYASLSPTLTAGRELDYELEMRRDTVKKLRAMADVLAGLLTIDAYDAKFGQPPAAPATSSTSTAAPASTTGAAPSSAAASSSGPATPKRSTMPPTTMSPLPSLPEEPLAQTVVAVEPSSPWEKEGEAFAQSPGSLLLAGGTTETITPSKSDPESATATYLYVSDAEAVAVAEPPAVVTATPTPTESLSNRASEGAATMHEEAALLDTMREEGPLLASMSQEDTPVNDGYWE